MYIKNKEKLNKFYRRYRQKVIMSITNNYVDMGDGLYEYKLRAIAMSMFSRKVISLVSRIKKLDRYKYMSSIKDKRQVFGKSIRDKETVDRLLDFKRGKLVYRKRSKPMPNISKDKVYLLSSRYFAYTENNIKSTDYIINKIIEDNYIYVPDGIEKYDFLLMLYNKEELNNMIERGGVA